MRGVSGELVVEAESGRMSCPYCMAGRTNLNGTRKGKQIYQCQGCGKQWRQGGAMGGHSYSPDQIGAAIQMYYTGLSFRQTARALKDQFGIQDADVSPQTIRNWVNRYTDAGIRLARASRVPAGGMWWVFVRTTFRPLTLDWVMVVDDRSRCILGNYVGDSEEAFGIKKALLEAWDLTGRPVDELGILYFSLKIDWRSAGGSEEVPSACSVHNMIDPRLNKRIELTDAFPPRFNQHKILREYRAACVRFERKTDAAEVGRYLAGWVITRNLFTKQRELGGRTPGQAGGITSPITAWADVVRLEAQGFLPTADPKASVATLLPSRDADEGV